MPCPIARVFCALALTVSALTTPVASALGGGTEQFTRVFMPQSSDGNGAACLDGTPPVLYFRPGTGDGAPWQLGAIESLQVPLVSPIFSPY